MKKRSVGPYFLLSLTSLLAVLAVAFEAAAQTIPNPSFEADRYTNAPGYASQNGGVITGWTISNTNYTGLRLSPGPGPFANNGAVPNGTNVAFIQTYLGTTNTLSTTISGLVPGTTYRVTFRANCRTTVQYPISAEWSLNGGAFVLFKASPPVGGSNPYYTNSATFTATGNTAALVLRNGLPTGNDATVLVDDFRITPVPGWSVHAWSNDSSSGIVLGQTVWAYHFGSADVAVVDGVNVPGIDRGNPGVPGQFSVSDNPSRFEGHVNNLTDLGGSGSAVMARGFIYGCCDKPGSITLQGLTIGEVYTLSFFGVTRDSPPNNGTHTFTSGTNSIVVDGNSFGGGDGLRVDYSFVATTNTSLTIVTVTPTNYDTFYTCGLALRQSTPVAQPSVATTPATAYTSTSATLNGRITPGSVNAATWFEWGTTTDYGNFTPTNTLAAGTNFQEVSYPLTGLIPGNTYQYRVAASNESGVSFGLNFSFTAPLAFTHVPIAGLPGVDSGSVAWGDYDNDGRLDFLLTGRTQVGDGGAISQLWRNTGSGFTHVPIDGLPGVWLGSAAWGDYDNDGNLDFFLTGRFFDGVDYPISQLWRNTGSGFTNVPIPGLPGVSHSSVAWGDYDNDGRLDFLLSGDDRSYGLIAQLWRNTANGFTNVPIAGLGGRGIGVAWADYDNDGRRDFVIAAGWPGVSSELWRNTGSGFAYVRVPDLSITGPMPAAWGDYNNDGRLDFVITGWDLSQLFLNTANGFARQYVGLQLPRALNSSVAGGDYDNDGRIDILLAGLTPEGRSTQLWRNTRGPSVLRDVVFIKVPIAGLPGVNYASVAWGDYDNDGRLDFLLTGQTASGPIAQLWRNTALVTNGPPAAPAGLALTATTNSVMLSWNSATDDHTPAGSLTYNVRAGTTPGGIDLLAGHVNATNGFCRIPAMGNAYLRNSLPLTGLTNGQTVYWSVQAVDGAFAGGPFATETSVVTLPQLALSRSDATNALVRWTPPTWGWSLQESPVVTGPWTNAPSGELNPATVPLTNAPNIFFRLGQ